MAAVLRKSPTIKGAVSEFDGFVMLRNSTTNTPVDCALQTKTQIQHFAGPCNFRCSKSDQSVKLSHNAFVRLALVDWSPLRLLAMDIPSLFPFQIINAVDIRDSARSRMRLARARKFRWKWPGENIKYYLTSRPGGIQAWSLARMRVFRNFLSR